MTIWEVIIAALAGSLVGMGGYYGVSQAAFCVLFRVIGGSLFQLRTKTSEGLRENVARTPRTNLTNGLISWAYGP